MMTPPSLVSASGAFLRLVDQKQHACATNHDKKDEERQQALASFSIRPQPVSA
jgi:hypothetical protein